MLMASDIRQICDWLRSFPLALRQVTIQGDVVSRGGTLYVVPPGVSLTIVGNVVMEAGKDVYISTEETL